jgi:hypothetical protein
MNHRTEAAGREAVRLARKIRPGPRRHHLDELNQRVTELEDELQEARRLNLRVAELLDLVEELLVPVALRDEDKVRRYLDSHASVL